ncbi:CDGSH iron-sulfur domain-containing protein [Ruegeria arenilitoris]|uniref:CDGSH iron-sulfur domain-containing protein n=1 Tax=Ruegeria arenilitoris TaxID=1173585 RepID=UPI0014808149|nr:CDGSH iron-sulfur domain-containing protein [Ruegeria arenilitoris]
MSDKTIVEERENGPLIVKNLHSMRGSDGSEIEVKQVMALCRCGHSANKPFCDGTHSKVGFESRGGTPAGSDRIIGYRGESVTVSFNPLLCSHAAECGRLASNIFNPSQKPWVQPDRGTTEEVREVVSACPSGALALGDDETREHLHAARAQIEVQKDGPYWVLGVEPPIDLQAKGACQSKYVLCRCGKSGNKPFCDGTHRDIGWSDTD